MNVIDILNEINNIASTKEKIDVLKKNADNVELQHVLYYTYNPYMKYGISESKIMSMSFAENKSKTKDIWTMLDDLSKNNINDKLRDEFVEVVSSYEKEYQELIKHIVIKDLRIGVNVSSINKVWKNLIPIFKVQLANNFKDVELNDEEEIFITEKLDGIRCICIKQDDNVSLFSRQGRSIEGLIEIENEIRNIPGDFVLDGELIVSDNSIDSGEQYKQTMKIVRSLEPNKTGITYNIFDVLDVLDFKRGISNSRYNERRVVLDKNISKFNSSVISVVPLLYKGVDHSEIQKTLDRLCSNGREGIMINRNDYYKCKRNNSLLKCKKMNTCDLVVTGIEEGYGKNKDRLGNIVCDYKGFSLRVGSGFNDSQREYYWNNKNEIIGKIVEVSYFEETNNEQGGLSLRFPVFKHIRDDKNEPSYD